MPTAAVAFTAGDAFKGAAIQFVGTVGREIDAQATSNTFDVSGWTGTGTLTAPIAPGTVSSVTAAKNAGYTLTDNGTGRNILIGGGGIGLGGPNTITGNGNDILLSGTTIYNANTSSNIGALDAILAEWSSSDAYGVRIAKITKGIVVGSNSYGLNHLSAHSNLKTNTVGDGPTQKQYQNWFIVNSSDQVAQRDETVTIINT
jgi:hypothetical protein